MTSFLISTNFVTAKARYLSTFNKKTRINSWYLTDKNIIWTLEHLNTEGYESIGRLLSNLLFYPFVMQFIFVLLAMCSTGLVKPLNPWAVYFNCRVFNISLFPSTFLQWDICNWIKGHINTKWWTNKPENNVIVSFNHKLWVFLYIS